MAGVEQIAWENPRGDQRVTIEAARVREEHFYGRGRSEIWEPLAGSSQCNVNNAGRRAGRASTSSTPTTTGRWSTRPTPASPTSRPTAPSAVTSG